MAQAPMSRVDVLHLRIERMIEKYCPERMPDKESIFEKYKGHENDLLQAYVSKYGPEPPPPKRNPLEGATDEEIKDMLRFMISKHMPEKAKDAAALEKSLQAPAVVGKEKQALIAMYKKFGIPPEHKTGGATVAKGSSVSPPPAAGTVATAIPSATDAAKKTVGFQEPAKPAVNVNAPSETAATVQQQAAPIKPARKPLCDLPREDVVEKIPEALSKFAPQAILVRKVNKLNSNKNGFCPRVLVLTGYGLFLCEVSGTVKRFLLYEHVSVVLSCNEKPMPMLIQIVSNENPDLVFELTPFQENTANDAGTVLKTLLRLVDKVKNAMPRTRPRSGSRFENMQVNGQLLKSSKNRAEFLESLKMPTKEEKEPPRPIEDLFREHANKVPKGPKPGEEPPQTLTVPGADAQPKPSPIASEPPPGQTSALPNQEDVEALKKSILQAHNEKRAIHGSPPLQWSEDCAASAALAAAAAASKSLLHHSHLQGKLGPHGQNAYWSSPTPPTAVEAVETWYKERYQPGYDFSGQFGKPHPDTLHFTQVVWHSTTHVGAAVRNGYLFANYYPAGNTTGLFQNNVKLGMDKPEVQTTQGSDNQQQRDDVVKVTVTTATPPPVSQEKPGSYNAMQIEQQGTNIAPASSVEQQHQHQEVHPPAAVMRPLSPPRQLQPDESLVSTRQATPSTSQITTPRQAPVQMPVSMQVPPMQQQSQAQHIAMPEPSAADHQHQPRQQPPISTIPTLPSTSVQHMHEHDNYYHPQQPPIDEKKYHLQTTSGYNQPTSVLTEPNRQMDSHVSHSNLYLPSPTTSNPFDHSVPIQQHLDAPPPPNMLNGGGAAPQQAPSPLPSLSVRCASQQPLPPSSPQYPPELGSLPNAVGSQQASKGRQAPELDTQRSYAPLQATSTTVQPAVNSITLSDLLQRDTGVPLAPVHQQAPPQFSFPSAPPSTTAGEGEAHLQGLTSGDLYCPNNRQTNLATGPRHIAQEVFRGLPTSQYYSSEYQHQQPQHLREKYLSNHYRHHVSRGPSANSNGQSGDGFFLNTAPLTTSSPGIKFRNRATVGGNSNSLTAAPSFRHFSAVRNKTPPAEGSSSRNSPPSHNKAQGAFGTPNFDEVDEMVQYEPQMPPWPPIDDPAACIECVQEALLPYGSFAHQPTTVAEANESFILPRRFWNDLLRTVKKLPREFGSIDRPDALKVQLCNDDGTQSPIRSDVVVARPVFTLFRQRWMNQFNATVTIRRLNNNGGSPSRNSVLANTSTVHANQAFLDFVKPELAQALRQQQRQSDIDSVEILSIDIVQGSSNSARDDRQAFTVASNQWLSVVRRWNEMVWSQHQLQ